MDLYKIIDFRDLELSYHMVKIGIDGGQQFLKTFMSVLNFAQPTYKSTRMHIVTVE